MRRLAVLAFLGLASAACAMFAGPVAAPPQPANPSPENPTVASTLPPTESAPEQVVETPLPSSTPLPTPATSFSTTTRSETVGAVTVVTISNVTRYALVGTNAYQLDVYMRTLGPVDSTGFQWFALTEPSFDWQYPCECAEAGCMTGPVKVFVIVDYTLPTWEPPANASQTLVGQWMFFEGALTEHEQGHGDLASACGLMLGEALASIVPQATCEGVGGAVAAVTQPVFDECRAAQRAYEDETAHGQRDGVVWPS